MRSPSPCREDDARTRALLARITVAELEIATEAERAFLTALDGSCRTPIGALATIMGDEISFLGEVLTPDGTERWRREAAAPLGTEPHKAAQALGFALGAEIAADAGERARFGATGW